MSKKLLAMLLCAILVVTLLPVTAMAEDTEESVWIWGKELTSETPYYHNGEDGTQGTVDATPTDANAYFDAASGVLTLDGLNVSDSDATQTIVIGGDSISFIYAICALRDLTIDLKDVSVISTADKEDAINIAFGVIGDVAFQGDGELTATAGHGAYDADLVSYGMYVAGDLTVKGGTLIGDGGASVS